MHTHEELELLLELTRLAHRLAEIESRLREISDEAGAKEPSMAAHSGGASALGLPALIDGPQPPEREHRVRRKWRGRGRPRMGSKGASRRSR